MPEEQKGEAGDLGALFTQDQKPVSAGQAAASAAKCVLVVDDSYLSRKAIAAVLQELDCRVVEATNGQQGLEMARTLSPYLIILDIVMPGISGLAFLKTLHQDHEVLQTPKPKVAMLTSKADLATVSVALRTGANDYLLKHSSPEEIRKRLQRLLAP